MMKIALVGLVVLGSVSVAEAMPVSPSAPSTGASLPVVKAEVIVKKVIHRRPPPVVRKKVVVKKTIVR